ncbi:MAG: antibiotic biosynthesis monooxygenase [Alphaproteobacteria bacterium]|nr:antibiotic biosynthesis monooxygenase [Alphaproteobacteria bacterium]
MFAVIFEVHPKTEQWDDYLHQAGLLRPELVEIDGFLTNERYASLQHEGWVLSLSLWRDEKAVIRWRTFARHHETQEKGRFEIFADYHLRVGEVTADSGLAAGEALREQRFDETETGDATHLVLAERTIAELPEKPAAADVMTRLGLPAPDALVGLVERDVFRHLQRPDDYLLLTSWKTPMAADAWLPRRQGDGARYRRVRVIRDYGMFDRREAPQYYPPAPRP